MPDELIIGWHSHPQPSPTATLGEAPRAAASFNQSAASNPAIASLLQSWRPVGRVAELGSLDD